MADSASDAPYGPVDPWAVIAAAAERRTPSGRVAGLRPPLRSTGSPTEVHVIRFRSRAGYESFMADPDRLDHRGKLGDAAPTTRVLEVREVW